MIRNMIKGAAAFFVVGAALGALLPVLAGAIGTGTMVAGFSSGTLALWQGSLFAVFGFLAPPAQALCNKIFGDPEGIAARSHTEETSVLKARINELEGREQALENRLTTPSQAVAKILNRTSRDESFAAREEARETGNPASPTIH